MKEKWENFYQHYSVNQFGKVRNDNTNSILKTWKCNGGYEVIRLGKGSGTYFKIHRLVAQAFIPNPNNLPQVNHKDGNKLNNNVNNLEWCTQSYNIQHADTNGLRSMPKGENASNAKLTNKQVKWILKHYIPKDETYGGQALAKRFGVCRSTIVHILSGMTFKNITTKYVRMKNNKVIEYSDTEHKGE